MEKNEKLHHFLLVGEIVFREPNSEQINALRVNGILIAPEKALPVRQIGKAQQVLQLNFFKRMQIPDLQVVDVVLVNIIHLGEFTQEEFHQPPEGTVLKEKENGSILSAVPDLEQAVAEASAKPE